MSRATKEQPAVKRTKTAAKSVAETTRPRSKPVDIPKPAPAPRKPRQAKPSSDDKKPLVSPAKAERAVKLTPKQKNEALKLKLQQLLEEI